MTPTTGHVVVTSVRSGGAAEVLDLVDRIEAVLFMADRPVGVAELAMTLEVDRKVADAALARLETRIDGTGLRLQRAGRDVQLVTAPEAAPDVQRFLGLESSAHLSAAALETLAIVAYRQPVTRPEIEELRGVNCDAVLRTLLSRGLVAEVGRRQTVGLPIEYGTSFRFLEYFGLESLLALPDVGDIAGNGPPAGGDIKGQRPIAIGNGTPSVGTSNATPSEGIPNGRSRSPLFMGVAGDD